MVGSVAFTVYAGHDLEAGNVGEDSDRGGWVLLSCEDGAAEDVAGVSGAGAIYHVVVGDAQSGVGSAGVVELDGVRLVEVGGGGGLGDVLDDEPGGDADDLEVVAVGDFVAERLERVLAGGGSGVPGGFDVGSGESSRDVDLWEGGGRERTK